MKIGIITFHRALNYGAVLQAYALSETISQIDSAVDAEVIDYRSPYIEGGYKPFTIVGETNIKNIIIALLTMRGRIVKRKKFDQFASKYVRISKKSYRREQLTEANEEYQSFITGSDQVFNDVCTGFDKSYFLDFVSQDLKKNSYAASFGFERIPNGLENDYKMLLQNFNRLSVREEAGKKIIYDLLGRESYLHIDPTFLLGKDEWSKVAVKPKETKYILVYLLQPSKTIFDFVDKLSKKTGCTPLLMHLHFFKPNGIKQIVTAGPDEFLGYFANAEYVVTNSFHGTAFSTIFNKKFFVEYQTTAAARNSRQKNLLQLLGLENRVISKDTEAELLNNLDAPIDYTNVEKIISKEREKSKDYLEQIILRLK